MIRCKPLLGTFVEISTEDGEHSLHAIAVSYTHLDVYKRQVYDHHNIQAALTMRNFMDTLRSSGVETGGPAAFSQSDRQAFANQLDKYIQSIKQ